MERFEKTENQPPLKTAQQYYDRARVHFYDNVFDKALADCTEAILRDKEFRQAWFLRGDIYSDTGKHDLAIENFTQALRLLSEEKLFPGERSCFKAVILCRIATANLAQGNLEEAIRNSSESAELRENHTVTKDSAESWYIQGVAWSERNSFEDALRCFDKAIAKGSSYTHWAYSLVERARISRKSWKPDQGLEDCNRVLREHPHNAEALVERACCRSAEALKWSDKDLEDFRRAVGLRPKYPEAWHLLADCLFGTGQLEEAGEVAAKALQMNLENKNVIRRLQSIMEASQREKEAREKFLAYYHAFVRSHPDAKISFHGKDAPIGEKEFDEAIGMMNRSLFVDPNDVVDRSKRIAAWIGKGNFEKAKEDLDKLIEAHPDNTDFRQMMNLVEFFRI